jgi:hypothetical protein
VTYRVLPFPPEVASHARATRSDSFGHAGLRPIRVDESPGYPCRVCLREAAVGDEVFLIAHRASPVEHPHSVVGPVYVHAHACVPWAAAGSLPPIVSTRSMALRAYDAAGDLVACDLAEGPQLDAAIARLFEDSRAAAVHLHFARAGCFACRLERS